MGRDHDVWDVHTDKDRWWVVTNPTNLYSQTLMPSLDYTLSFDVGLMARNGRLDTLAARRRRIPHTVIFQPKDTTLNDPEWGGTACPV